MKILPYPNYDSVFESNDLKRIFLPLCSVEINDNEFHFVHAFGFWENESGRTKFNSVRHNIFKIKNGRYQFQGDLTLYNDLNAKKILFEHLSRKWPSEKFEEWIKHKTRFSQVLKSYITVAGDDQYMQQYYFYGMNKTLYQKRRKFGGYREVIEGWGKAEKSLIVYDANTSNFKTGFEEIVLNKKYLLPDEIDLNDFEKIGMVIGSEFLVQGSDVYLLWNKSTNEVLTIYN